MADGKLSPVATIGVFQDSSFQDSTVHKMLQQRGFEVFTYCSVDDFSRGIKEGSVDIIVLDCQQNLDHVLGEISDIRRTERCIPFLVLATNPTVEVVVRSMRLGAITVLEKPLNQHLFLSAVESAVSMSAERRRQRARRELIVDRIRRLTRRELEVLKLVLEGNSSKDVAKTIGCSTKTVDVHRSRIVAKLEVKSINEVVHELVASGLELDRPYGLPIEPNDN